LIRFSNVRQEALLSMTSMGLRVEGRQIPMKRTFVDIPIGEEEEQEVRVPGQGLDPGLVWVDPLMRM
jgi:hypothetical protein